MQSAAQRIDGTELGSVIETLVNAHAPTLERRALANILRELGEQLIERAQRLLDDAGERRALMRVVAASDTRLLLTQREREVATRIAEGCSNRQIARELVITNSTVERHVANILSKLGMRSRSQVAVWAVREGLAEVG
ncbi:MAG TPA: LuxR C-terminal-related transcriptional regulator [Chloroflexota bacterium]|jgi:DNA-binding NarL/FixJ family response regulator